MGRSVLERLLSLLFLTGWFLDQNSSLVKQNEKEAVRSNDLLFYLLLRSVDLSISFMALVALAKIVPVETSIPGIIAAPFGF